MHSFSTHGYVLETSEENGGKRCHVNVYQHGVLQYEFYSNAPYAKVRGVDIYEDFSGGVVYVLVSTMHEIILYTGNCVSTRRISIHSPEHVRFVPSSTMIVFITTSQDEQRKKVLSFADYRNEFVIQPNPFPFGTCDIINVHVCSGVVSAVAMKKSDSGTGTLAIWMYFTRTSKPQRITKRASANIINSTMHADKSGRTARMYIVSSDNSLLMASMDIGTEKIVFLPLQESPSYFKGLSCVVKDSVGKTYAALSDGVILCCSEDMSSVRYLVTNIHVPVKDIIVNNDEGKVAYVTPDGKMVDVHSGRRHSCISHDEEEKLNQFFIDICI